jgi:ammonia channel protein AmtB
MLAVLVVACWSIGLTGLFFIVTKKFARVNKDEEEFGFDQNEHGVQYSSMSDINKIEK